MSTWIDCPEQAPAPGWWWFRKPDSEDLNPVELWIDLKERHVVGPAAWMWGEWRRQGWQMWPIPIAQPGSEKPAPSIRLLSDAEVQSLRWAIARARTSPATPSDGEECNVDAAIVDRLATAGAVISPEVDRATVEAARELCATLSNHPAAANHLRMYPDMLPGPLHQIARWAREWSPTAPAPEPLPRSTEQELRAWAAEAQRREGTEATPSRGYLEAVEQVLEILDAAGDELDPEDEAEEDCAALSRRIDRLETAAEAHVEELGSFDRRVRGLERRLDGAEQARAEQQAATAAELKELRRLVEGLRR